MGFLKQKHNYICVAVSTLGHKFPCGKYGDFSGNFSHWESKPLSSSQSHSHRFGSQGEAPRRSAVPEAGLPAGPGTRPFSCDPAHPEAQSSAPRRSGEQASPGGARCRRRKAISLPCLCSLLPTKGLPRAGAGPLPTLLVRPGRRWAQGRVDGGQPRSKSRLSEAGFALLNMRLGSQDEVRGFIVGGLPLEGKGACRLEAAREVEPKPTPEGLEG